MIGRGRGAAVRGGAIQGDGRGVHGGRGGAQDLMITVSVTVVYNMYKAFARL